MSIITQELHDRLRHIVRLHTQNFDLHLCQT